MQKHDENDPLKTRRQREVDRLRELYEKRPRSDDGFDFEGVLLSDAIKRCVESFALIEPFNQENLKAACYKLTVGDEYAIGGKINPLSDEPGKNEIRIPPFEVAVIKTHETINMPRFLIGRWNIQVSRAYKGLVWVGGPQVDAGYVGHLFCPIYNLSDQDVLLFKGEPIAVIDFVPTTRFHPGKSEPYKFPPDRVLFEEYEPNRLVSGLVSQAKERLDQVETGLKTSVERSDRQIAAVQQGIEGFKSAIQQRVDNFISLTFAVVAILFAAISVSAFGKESPPWQYVSVFLLSGFALFFAASAWLKSKTEGRLFGRSVQVIVVVGITLAFFFQLFWCRAQREQIRELSKEILELKRARPMSTSAPTKTPDPPVEALGPDGKTSSTNKTEP
jgi:deoxycytidine triphosphate deaminase